MKTASDELFTLIKSLNKYEKRHFRTRAKEHAESAAYLQLFEAIDSMDTFNDQELKARLAKTGGPTQLKRIKSYLQERILMLLEDYYSDYSTDIQIQRLLQRIEVLLEKRLFDHAWKAVDKAEKLARDFGKYNYLLIIYDWKKRAMSYQSDLPRMKAYLRKEGGEELRMAEINTNLISYLNLQMRLNAILKTRYEGANEKMAAELKQLLADPLLENEANALSRQSKIIYYFMLASIYRYSKEGLEKSYDCFSKALELSQQTDKYDSEGARYYIGLINGFSFLLEDMDKIAEMKSINEKANQFFHTRPHKMQEGLLLHKYIGVRLNYMAYLGGNLLLPEEALEEAEKIRKIMEGEVEPTSILVYYANCAMCYFLTEDYHAVLRCINKMLNWEKAGAGVRRDIICDFRIRGIFVHYELDNGEILPSLCKSAARYLKKQSDFNAGDELILHFFSKTILKQNTRQEKKQAFIHFRKEIEVFLTSRGAAFRDALYRWVLEWTEAKIEGISLLEMQRRMKQEGRK